MAVRNPTDFTRWLDIESLTAGRIIKAATADAIRNDQVYVLDAEMLLLSEMVEDYSWTSAAYVTIALWGEMYSKDMCSVAGVTNNEISHEWCVYAKSPAGTDGTMRLTSQAVASNTSEITIVGDGTWKFYGFGTINIKTNDILDYLLLEAKRTAGGGTMLFGGIGVFALVT